MSADGEGDASLHRAHPIAAPCPKGCAGHGDIQPHISRSLLEAPLQPENYKQKFQLLLHLEEIQLEVDIRRYDLQEVPMVQNGTLLLLNVSGDCCGAQGWGQLRAPDVTAHCRCLAWLRIARRCCGATTSLPA